MTDFLCKSGVPRCTPEPGGLPLNRLARADDPQRGKSAGKHVQPLRERGARDA